MSVVYLDHHAATPMDDEVRAVVDLARREAWANPSSVHAPGRAARAWLERARERVATAIGASAADVVLTAGGTEAINLGVLGVGPRARRVVTTEIEHPAVSESIRALEQAGASVIRLAVPHGRAPSEAELDEALAGADLAALGWVNHETGTVLPIERYAERCRARGVPLVVDATQALGKLPVDVRALGATAVAFASSKVGGPPGAGALWIARDAELRPRILGGGQERGRRAGTPDAATMAGFGAACERLPARLAAMPEVARRRDRLEQALLAAGAVVNGAAGARVATVTNVSLPGWRGPSLVAALDLEGVAAASGAACSSGLDQPSPVLAAMHADEPWRATSALRLSLSPSTSDADVDRAIDALTRVLERRRR
jgi:cysteine desulfurase